MNLELEDLLLTVAAHETLLDIHQHLPQGVRLRAAKVQLPLGQVLARGGFGELNALPLRHEVLGLTYQSQQGAIEVGGTVVKNVSGYDFTRLLIGCGVNAFLGAHLRLRPEAASRLFRTTERPDFAVLRAAGWQYAWRTAAHTYVEGAAEATAFEEVAACTDLPTEDARGPLDLPVPHNDLSHMVLDTLQLVPV